MILNSDCKVGKEPQTADVIEKRLNVSKEFKKKCLY